MKIKNMLYPVYNSIRIDGKYIGYEAKDFTKEQLDIDWPAEQREELHDADGYLCINLLSKELLKNRKQLKEIKETPEYKGLISISHALFSTRISKELQHISGEAVLTNAISKSKLDIEMIINNLQHELKLKEIKTNKLNFGSCFICDDAAVANSIDPEELDMSVCKEHQQQEKKVFNGN